MREDNPYHNLRQVTRPVEEVGGYKLPENIVERSAFMKSVRNDIAENTKLKEIASQVHQLLQAFPLE